MIKNKFKLSFCIFTIFCIISSICFATNANSDVVPISMEGGAPVDTSTPSDVRYNDLYISDKETTVSNTIIGNVYASVDTLNITPTSGSTSASSVISGNLFATAGTVSIKSDVSYSDEIDKDGAQKISSINKFPIISGNVFVTANKFIIDPGVEIKGDLFICANEVILSKSAVVYGNIYAVCNKMDLNCQVSGDLYTSCKDFNMNYYGIVYRDLHINSGNANIGGYAYRNLFISSDSIVTTSNFICAKDLTVEDANKFIFSGKVQGNATVKSKQIEFKNEKDGKSIDCKIIGDFNYTSKNEIEVSKDIIAGNSNFTKYTSNPLKGIGSFLISLLASLIYVLVAYWIIKKFMPNFFNKLSNVSTKNMLINLAIGLGILILVPLACILLLITGVGSSLGVVLAMLYVVVLLIATPIFAILITEYIKKMTKTTINSFALLIIVTVILQLLFKIPFVGSILSFLAILTAIGNTCVLALKKN